MVHYGKQVCVFASLDVEQDVGECLAGFYISSRWCGCFRPNNSRTLFKVVGNVLAKNGRFSGFLSI